MENELPSVEGRISPPLKPTAPTGWLTSLGLLLTICYLAVAVALLVHGEVKITGLAANELGDFLAGVFAPLAFLWLVLGFFLQRQELSHSSAALWLQSEELAKSVEHQRELAEQTRRQVDAELQSAKRAMDQAEAAAQPLLVGTTGGSYSGTKVKMTFRINNAGTTCSDITVTVDTEVVARAALLTQAATLSFDKEWEHWMDMDDVHGIFSYIDSRGVHMAKKFVALLRPNAGPNERHSLSNIEFSKELLTNDPS